MDKESRIIEFFERLKSKPERVAFIIALELSGENLVANKCKEIYELEREAE